MIELTAFQQLYFTSLILYIIFEVIRYNHHKKNSRSDEFLFWANRVRANMCVCCVATGIVFFLPDGDFIHTYIHYQFWEQFSGTCIKILTNIIQHFIVDKYGIPVTKIAPRLKILFFAELVGINGVNWQIMLTTTDLVHFYISFAYMGFADNLVILQDVVLIMYIYTFCFFYRALSKGLDLIMSKHDLIYQLKKLEEKECINIYQTTNTRINKRIQKIYNNYRKKEEKFIIALLDFVTVFVVILLCTVLI